MSTPVAVQEIEDNHQIERREIGYDLSVARDVFSYVDERTIAVNLEQGVEFFTRESVLRTGGIRIYPPFNSKSDYQLIASFSGQRLGSDTYVPFRLIGSAKNRQQADGLSKAIVQGLSAPSAGVVSREEVRPRSAWASVAAGAAKTVAAVGIGCVVLVAGAFYWASGPLDGGAGNAEADFDPSKVRAWGTPDMKPYGALDDGEIGIIREAGEIVGVDFRPVQNNTNARAQSFYVFSRLDCEDCATIDLALPDVSKEFAPVVIPANAGASMRSALGANHALCNSDSAAAWLIMAKTGQVPPVRTECAEWEDKVKGAEITFSLLDMPQVPAIVAPNGAVYSGSLKHIAPADRAAVLDEWLRANNGKAGK